MTEQKLSNEQIEQLFDFCNFHNVKYYDVQLELVDHIATSIEELWKTESTIQFEDALALVGEKFGIEPFVFSINNSLLPNPFGMEIKNENVFNAIVKSKEKELSKKYNRLQIRYIIKFFKLPKILLTLFSTVAIFSIYRYFNNDKLINTVFLIMSFVFILFYWSNIFRTKFKLRIKPGMHFLLYDHFREIRIRCLSFVSFIPSMHIYLKHISELSFNMPVLGSLNFQLFSAFFFTLFGIVFMAVGVYTPKRIKADFELQYPQFVKS